MYKELFYFIFKFCLSFIKKLFTQEKYFLQYM